MIEKKDIDLEQEIVDLKKKVSFHEHLSNHWSSAYNNECSKYYKLQGKCLEEHYDRSYTWFLIIVWLLLTNGIRIYLTSKGWL